MTGVQGHGSWRRRSRTSAHVGVVVGRMKGVAQSMSLSNNSKVGYGWS